MHKRSSTRKTVSDIDELTASIVETALDGVLEGGDGMEETKAGKNPAAVALGRLGGKKGGKARAAKLTATERREIAQKAAQARWQRRTEVEE